METLKAEAGWADLWAKLPELLVQFGAMGWPGWIAAGVLLLVAVGGGALVNRWVQARKQEDSDRANEGRGDDAQTGLPQDVSELERGAREGVAWLRERVAERMAQDLEEKIHRLELDAPVRGPYKTPSGWPRGAVVHYTAGREVLNEADALREMAAMVANGVAAFLIGTDGVIYAPRNLGWKDQHSHAGDSAWQGFSGVSRVCFGIEIACAGKLKPEGRVSWFGKPYPEVETRSSPGLENQAAGIYHRYTEAQEKALMDVLAWHLRYNPEFSVDWIVGHDEVAPGRKTDPGASLSVTLPALRRMLAEIRATQ